MKRTELIKNAINTRVKVVLHDDNAEYKGWLVVDKQRKNNYLLLPFVENYDFTSGCESIWSLRVSHVKHLTYISNGYRLW